MTTKEIAARKLTKSNLIALFELTRAIRWNGILFWYDIEKALDMGFTAKKMRDFSNQLHQIEKEDHTKNRKYAN